jgi:hypothetical protein
METPRDALDYLDLQSRADKMDSQEYLDWLLEFRDELDIHIETIRNDAKQLARQREIQNSEKYRDPKKPYFGSQQQEDDREQEDLTNSQR